MATDRPITNARRLRRDTTEAEKRLWSRLRARQIEDAKFVRRFPIGPYVVDFCCRSARLVVEVDGGQHADDPNDIIRSDRIADHGYLVIRFWNNDILANADGVLETIADMLRVARTG